MDPERSHFPTVLFSAINSCHCYIVLLIACYDMVPRNIGSAQQYDYQAVCVYRRTIVMELGLRFAPRQAGLVLVRMTDAAIVIFFTIRAHQEREREGLTASRPQRFRPVPAW